jgi:hypothetical protein
MYDIFYIGNNDTLKERLPFANQVDSVNNIKSNTKMYWVVDTNTKITNWEIFDFKPDTHTERYQHVWKWNSENYGGVSLLPKRENTETVWHNKVVCKKYFDMLFEEAPGNYFEQNPNSTHVWCVDSEYILGEDIDWAPGNFEPNFIHSFHLRGQLEHKYPKQEGGVKLYPREWEHADVKYHKFLNAKADYPVFFTKDTTRYAQRNTYNHDYVWLVDAQYKPNLNTFDWVPNPFEADMIHVFKMPYQLQEKYPEAMGGITLVPRAWTGAEIKIHKACPIEDEAYDVFYVDEDEFTAETYSEYAERSKTEWFWIVDRDHTFNGKLLFVPSVHEREYIHVFKIPGHLEERYPLDCTDAWDNRCGGVRLVHKDFDMTKHKHQEDICPVRYDIFYADDINDYETPARKSRTKMFWLVDSEHQINEEFKYVPQRYDQKCIQVFKFPNDLEHKYPKAITNISDNRAGGIKLVPINGSGDTKYNEQSPVGGKTYPIRFTDASDESLAEDSWIVPTAFEDAISSIPWQPSVFEKNTQHVFANGLLRWMPVDWNGEIKEHDFSPVVMDIQFEKFESYAQGLAESSFNWFWVIDKDVTVLETFDFDFQPNVFDEGKQHVWQKLNPITNKQYDYGGVSLRHKDEKKGRPKYIREPACTQQEFPVYHIQPEDIERCLDGAYEVLAASTSTSMMWVVDSLVDVDEDFDFSYYPTQYDKDVVHIWEHNGSSRATGVRLLPTNIKYTSAEQIIENKFDRLKQMPKVASKETVWPCEQLTEVTVAGVQAILDKHSDSHYVWTVDPDVEQDNNIIAESIIPHEKFINNVHVWKTSVGAGGLRLWPTTYDTSKLTDEQVLTSSIPDQLIIDAVAGEHKEYAVCYLNRDSSLLEQINQFSDQCESNMFWVVDPHVELMDDWTFDYIPNRWEGQVVHIWQHKGNSKNSGVKLMPKGTYRQQEVKDNSYPSLKEMSGVASKDPVWPVEQLHDLTSKEVQSILSKHKDVGYVWTVDPDIELDADIISQSIIPHTDNSNIVHVWKRTDSEGLVIGHGGLRLWPTSYDASQLTDEQILTCSIPEQLILDAVAGEQKEYPKYWLDGELDILEQLADFDNRCESAMYWVMDPYITLATNWNYDFIPTKWEEDIVHVFQDTNQDFRSLRLVPKGTFDDKQYSIKQIVNNSFSKLKKVYTPATVPTHWKQYNLGILDGTLKQHMDNIQSENEDWFFTIDDDVQELEQFVFSYTPQLDSVRKAHVWQRLNPTTGLTQSYGGVRLWPNPVSTVIKELTSDKIRLNKLDAGKLQYVKQPASEIKPYNVFMLSYKEDIDVVEQHIQAIERKGLTVKHVRGVEGIFNAHKHCAEQADTKLFWVVDADALVHDEFNFDYIPDVYDQDVVHVWASKNPVTGEEYGYGGVKLFNTEQVRGATSWGLDFTTGLSKRFKAMPQISCVTNFNIDAESTWRSAFRECVKLTLGRERDPDAQRRLESWLHPIEGSDFMLVAKLGAEQGKQFAIKHKDNAEQLNKINDYEWLESEWTKSRDTSELG